MSKQNSTSQWPSVNRQKTIKETVVYELVDAMLDGRLPIGSLLPPEPEMCQKLGVSRVAFREAVKQLEVLGFLRIDRGNGTVVTEPSFTCLEPIIEFLGKSNAVSFADLHHVRTLVEVEAVRLVALTRNDELLDRLQAILNEVEENFDEMTSHTELDYEFHKTILEACPNKLLSLIMSPFAAQLRRSRILSFRDLDAAEKTLETHRQILQAIRDRDAEQAAIAMTRHLSETAKDLDLTP